ncbi:MAG: exosortase H [Bacteroidota bacterium]
MAQKRKQKKQANTSASSWWQEKKPVLRFAGGFIVAIFLMFWVTSGSFFDSIKEPLLHVYASISATFLGWLGYSISAVGPVMSSADFSVSIEEGCDAIAPAILFTAAILVFPGDWRKKLQGIILGLLAIFILNIIRVVTLFLTGVHAESYFDLMHVEVWQTLFIISTLGMWLFWLKWANPLEKHA